MVLDVERAVRFIRYNAKQWQVDPGKIALIGGSAGGFLSNMVGLKNARGNPNAADRWTGRAPRCRRWSVSMRRAALNLFPLTSNVHQLLDPLIARKGKKGGS